MLTKDLPLNRAGIKFSEGDARVFSGYASVFNGVDSYGDTIAPGAYAKTLESRERPVQMRWNHYGPIIGKWTKMEEDETGLYVEGELTPGHSVAEDAYALLKHGSVNGLSIGYRVNAYEEEDDKRILKEIDLVEVSVVESPADLNAMIGDVKSRIEGFERLKDFEAFLRDAAGLKAAEAKAFVSRLKSLVVRDEEPEADAPKMGEALRALNLIRRNLEVSK